MKVLLTHHYFPPDFAGGGEYIVLETARGLMARGVEVQVLTTGDPGITDYAGIPTTRLPIHRYRFNLAARRIAEMARGVDLIQTFNYHACLPSLVAGKWEGKPVVCYVLGLFHEFWKEMRPRGGSLWSALEKYQIKRGFSRLIFPSDHSRDTAVALGVRADRAVVNYPAIALENYGPAPVKDDAVFFTGKLDFRKGAYDVMEVARELPHVAFRVMGWGPEETSVRNIAPPNVEFLDFRKGEPAESLRKAFGGARIFLFPSRSEPFGLALAEAMASGCAIVSPSPVSFEGVRVAAGDRRAMVEAVSALWADRQATERMGRKNMVLAQYYNWDRFTTSMLQVYSEVLPRVA